MSNTLAGTKWLFSPTQNDFTPFVATFDASGAVTLAFTQGCTATGVGTYVQSPNLRSFTIQAQISDGAVLTGAGSHKQAVGGGNFTFTYQSEVAGVQHSPFVMQKQ